MTATKRTFAIPPKKVERVATKPEETLLKIDARFSATLSIGEFPAISVAITPALSRLCISTPPILEVPGKNSETKGTMFTSSPIKTGTKK